MATEGFVSHRLQPVERNGHLSLCLRIGGLGGKSDAEAQDGRRACR